MGAQAIGIDAFNGTGVSLTTWHSTTHSEVDTLLFSGTGSYYHAQNTLPQNNPNLFLSYGASIISLQRWRLWPLGKSVNLDFVTGPFVSSNGSGSYDIKQGTTLTSAEITYALGLKTGLDVECFFARNWSLCAGYQLTLQGSTTGANPFFSEWSFSFGNALIGLNYYFR